MITQTFSGVLTRWKGTNRIVITLPLEANDVHICKVSWADNEVKIVGHIMNPHDEPSTDRGSDQNRMDASYFHQLS